MPATSRPRSTLLTIFALWAVFYASFTLFAPALLDDADSVHAEVAREMLLRPDWITLYANGLRYLEKAPLLYWSMAASFKLFGVSTAAARLPLALTVLWLAFAVETFARRAFRSTRAGLYAALILLSSPGIFLFTRILLPDAMVCLWLTLAMLCFWLTEQLHECRNRPRNPTLLYRNEALSLRLLCYAFAGCCALGVLTKGLIGIVFPVGIALAYLFLMGNRQAALKRICQLHPLSSLTVFLVLAAPWHILSALANPTQGHPGNLNFAHHHWNVPLPTDGNVHGWLWFYFVNEQLLRYLNLRVPRDYDTVPLWLFWGLCLIWLTPWSAFVWKSIYAVYMQCLCTIRDLPQKHSLFVNRLRWNKAGASVQAPIFLTLWSAFVLLFFAFSTRQEYYVLPALPPIAILAGGWLASDKQTGSQPRTKETEFFRRANHRCTAMLLAIGAIFAVASLVFLLHTHTHAPDTDLAALLQQNPGDYAMSMGHFLDLNAQALGLFRLPLAIAAASLFLGPLVSYVLRKRAQPHAATLALAAGAFGFLFAAHLGLQTFAPVLSSQQLAAAVAPQLHPDDLIVIHQEYEYASTLGFYLHRPSYTQEKSRPVAVNAIHLLEGRSSNLWYGSFFPDAPPIFETPQTLAAKWLGPQRIFLWQDHANQPSPLPTLPGPVYVIAKSGGKEIVSNQPNHP